MENTKETQKTEKPKGGLVKHNHGGKKVKYNLIQRTTMVNIITMVTQDIMVRKIIKIIKPILFMPRKITNQKKKLTLILLSF